MAKGSKILGCEIPLMTMRRPRDRSVVWTGDMFCAHCPEEQPEGCPGDCEPDTGRFCTEYHGVCPCSLPATPERWMAFRKWVERRFKVEAQVERYDREVRERRAVERHIMNQADKVHGYGE